MDDLSHNPSVLNWNREFKIEVYIKCSFPGRKVKFNSFIPSNTPTETDSSSIRLQ